MVSTMNLNIVWRALCLFNSAMEFSKQGAFGLILHYYGDEETNQEVKTLQESIQNSSQTKTLTVPGDIADPETSKKVGVTVEDYII